MYATRTLVMMGMTCHSNNSRHVCMDGWQPENMMLTMGGHVKLVDFGTCKDLLETDINGGEFVGTAQYMSPQAVASEEQVTAVF